MAELVYAHDSKSCSARIEGSIPSSPTTIIMTDEYPLGGDRRFVRVEGFFPADTAEEIAKLASQGPLGSVAVSRFRNDLLEDVPTVGNVVTRSSLVDFGKNNYGYNRAVTAYQSLRSHIQYAHGSGEGSCACCLAGGRAAWTHGRRWLHVDYIEPAGLVDQFVANGLEHVAIDSSPPPSSRPRQSASLTSSVSYHLLELYIKRLAGLTP